MPKKGKPKSKPPRPADPGAAKREAEVAPHCQLYVGNLPLGQMTDEMMQELFSACGDVQVADVHNTAKHSFGFVTFRTVAEATRAIEMMNGKDEMTVKYSSNPVPEESAPLAAPQRGEEQEDEDGSEGEGRARDDAEDGVRSGGGVPRSVLTRECAQPVESLQDLVQKAIRTTSTRDNIVYTIKEASTGQFVGTVKIIVPAGEVSQSSEPQPNKKEAKRAAALAAMRDPEVHRLLPPLPTKAKQAQEEPREEDSDDEADEDSVEEERAATGRQGEQASEDESEDADEDEEDEEDEEVDEAESSEDEEDEKGADQEDEDEEDDDEEEEEDADTTIVAAKLRTVRWPVAGKEVAVVTGGAAPTVKAVPGGAVAALRVSPDAVAVMRWLEEAADGEEELARGPALFVELGCGVGLLGLACAALRPEAQVVLTDIKAVLPYAQRSVEANSKAVASRVSIRKLRFGEPGSVRSLLREFGATAEDGEPPRPVVAVGAAITFWECVYEPLVVTLVELCSEGGEAVIGYFRRDWKVERRFWTKLLPASGLIAEVLWEGEVESPEDAVSCAPACTRTPGEWNARVYRVSKSASSFNPPPREPYPEASKKDALAEKKERELRAAESHRQQQLARQAKLASKKKKYCRDTKLGEKLSTKHEKREAEVTG